jgi:hypothetical protein
MAQITLIEAVTQALAYEMAHDDSVVVLGEDVGVNGGVFRATQGLQEKFGELRVLDTPLDETTIAGVTVGLATQGMKLHLSDDGTDRLPRRAPAQPHARPPHRASRVARAVGWWHSRAGASLRSQRTSVHQYPRPARGDAVVARTRLWPVARRDPRSGSGDVLRTQAHLRWTCASCCATAPTSPS